MKVITGMKLKNKEVVREEAKDELVVAVVYPPLYIMYNDVVTVIVGLTD